MEIKEAHLVLAFMLNLINSTSMSAALACRLFLLYLSKKVVLKAISRDCFRKECVILIYWLFIIKMIKSLDSSVGHQHPSVDICCADTQVKRMIKSAVFFQVLEIFLHLWFSEMQYLLWILKSFIVQYKWQKVEQCFPRIALKSMDLGSKLCRKILPWILN